MSSLEATATGNLATTPLLDLLIYLLDHRLTGTWVLEEPDGQKHAIYFSDGAPAKVTGEEAGPAEVLVALAGCNPESVYGFYEGQDLLTELAEISPRPPALFLIWTLLERVADRARITALLSRLGDAPLRLHPQTDRAAFGLSVSDRALLDRMAARPTPLPALRALGVVPGDRTDRLVCLLLLTRHLDLGGPAARGPIGVRSRRAGSSATFTAPREAGSATPETPEIAALKARIRERASDLEGDYYAALGVRREATAQEIQAAFLDLAKQWHPDRLGPEYAEVKELATRIFARASEAHRTLSDPAQRRAYDSRNKSVPAARQDAEEQQVRRVLNAATAFKKARILLKRGNLAEAEKEAKGALADDPQQAEYSALLAWIEAQKPKVDLRAVLRRLDDAIQKLPNDVTARWYRAQVLKRLGQERRMVRDLRFIVEKDARHVDAQRELRLYRMRHGGSQSSKPPGEPAPPSRPPSGASRLLGRIFKR